MFKTHPQVEDFFMPFTGLAKTDEQYSSTLRQHALRVMATVEKCIHRLDEPERMRNILEQLGSRHINYNAKIDYVDLLGSQFVMAVKENSPQWGDDLETSWLSLVKTITFFIKKGWLDRQELEATREATRKELLSKKARQTSSTTADRASRASKDLGLVYSMAEESVGEGSLKGKTKRSKRFWSRSSTMEGPGDDTTERSKASQTGEARSLELIDKSRTEDENSKASPTVDARSLELSLKSPTRDNVNVEFTVSETLEAVSLKLRSPTEDSENNANVKSSSEELRGAINEECKTSANRESRSLNKTSTGATVAENASTLATDVLSTMLPEGRKDNTTTDQPNATINSVLENNCAHSGSKKEDGKTVESSRQDSASSSEGFSQEKLLKKVMNGEANNTAHKLQHSECC
ncbi:hypothetical protein V1264_007819 [Littorina saxatilis]|uniref:Globin n=1 Tax=Littorina saxatilis TaxID=31220 RepID=A0AAN9G466_9CAEN